jgi:hypothetical protein
MKCWWERMDEAANESFFGKGAVKQQERVHSKMSHLLKPNRSLWTVRGRPVRFPAPATFWNAPAGAYSTWLLAG